MFRIYLIVALIIHSAITLYTLKDTGPLAPFPPFAELVSYQIFSDLIVSISIALLFIYQEIQRKSIKQKGFWICVFFTPIVGSFSPLIYLLWEKKLFK